MASQDDKRAGQPEALGIIQQAAMATVAPVETKVQGTLRYLEVPGGTCYFIGFHGTVATTVEQTRHSGRSGGREGFSRRARLSSTPTNFIQQHPLFVRSSLQILV